MNKVCLYTNSYGVEINIRIPVHARFNPVADELCLQEDKNLLSKHKTEQENVTNTHHFTSILIRIAAIPIQLLSIPVRFYRKVIQMFEESSSSYHYPTYPFHFPILIYGDYYPFGYYSDWILLENDGLETE